MKDAKVLKFKGVWGNYKKTFASKDNHGQNIFGKIKKSGKVGYDEKGLMSVLRNF